MPSKEFFSVKRLSLRARVAIVAALVLSLGGVVFVFQNSIFASSTTMGIFQNTASGETAEYSLGSDPGYYWQQIGTHTSYKTDSSTAATPKIKSAARRSISHQAASQTIMEGQAASISSPSDRLSSYISVISKALGSSTATKTTSSPTATSGSQYFGNALYNYLHGGINDQGAFQYFLSNSAKYGVPNAAADFKTMQNIASYSETYGGILNYIVLARSNIKQGAADPTKALFDATSFQYVVDHPLLFGLPISLKEDLAKDPDVSKYFTAIYGADAVKGNNLTASAQTLSDTGVPLAGSDTGVPLTGSDTGVPQSASVSAIGTAYSRSFVDPSVEHSTPYMQSALVIRQVMQTARNNGWTGSSNVTDAQVATAQQAAQKVLEQSGGDLTKAYQAFAAVLGKLPQSAANQKVLADLLADQKHAGLLAGLIMADPSDVNKMVFGATNDLVQYQKVADDMEANFNSFKTNLTPVILAADPVLKALMVDLQIMPGKTIAPIDLINALYDKYGQAVGDRAVAVFYAGTNDPTKIDQYMHLLALDPTVDNQGRKAYLNSLIKDNGGENAAFKLARLSSKTSLSIDPLTAALVYTSSIKKWDPTHLNPNGTIKQGEMQDIGYMSFDPVTKAFDAQLSDTFGGKDIQFVSDPRNGDVYATVASDLIDPKTGMRQALQKLGFLDLMKVQIASNGSVGGTFRYQNRVFSYNAITKAFEVPIILTDKGKVLVAQDLKPGEVGRGMVTIDTKGNITGSVSLYNNTPKSGIAQQGSLFMDRGGNIGLTYVATTNSVTQLKDASGTVIKDDHGNAVTKTTSRSLGGISVDLKGNINGTVNLGAAFNVKTDVFLGFGKDGITGISANIGSIAGSAVGVGIQKSGAISIGTFIPVGPIPVPISLGQNNRGDVALNWPGGSVKLCSLGLGKCENRTDVPSVPKADKDGKVDWSTVQCQHSYRQVFQTVKIYNEVKVDGEAAQSARSALIFKEFNDILGRNPGRAEYIDWYFIMDNQRGDNGYTDWDCNKNELLQFQLEKVLKASKEAQCYQKNGAAAGTKTAADCPGKPTDILPNDPLNVTATNTQTADQTTADQTTAETGDNQVTDLLNGITDSASSDPLWTGDGYTNVADSTNPTVDEVAKASIGLAKGYNAFFVPSNMTAVDASGLLTNEFVVFAFNRDGTKQWYSSERSSLLSAFTGGTGYYVYSRTGNVPIKLTDLPNSKPGVQIYQGWNLLANNSNTAQTLSTLTFNVANSSSCKDTSCTTNKSLRQLYTDSKGYENIYVVADDKTSDPAAAFQIVNVTTANADTVSIPAGKIFWFYMWQ